MNEKVFGNPTYLPGPEEWVYESVHAGQGKVHETLLDGFIPGCRVCPEGTVRVCGSGTQRSAEPESAVVEPVAELPGNIDAKRCLTVRVMGFSEGL